MWWWLLLTIILAGYYISTSFSELAAIFFGSSSFVIRAADNPGVLVKMSWHPPISSRINSLSSAINGTGTYGFVFNSSLLPEGTPYGI